MRTSWYSGFGKMITMNEMLIICVIVIKVGKEKRPGGGYFTLCQTEL